MRDFLLPTTDAGAAVQAVVVATSTVLAVVLSWRRRELRTFLFGVGFLTLSLMAVRTLH